MSQAETSLFSHVTFHYGNLTLALALGQQVITQLKPGDLETQTICWTWAWDMAQTCGYMGRDLNSEKAKSLRKIKRKDKKVFKKIYNLSVVDRVVVQFLGQSLGFDYCP